MIYFLDNSLQLQKIVTSKNVISAIHEHELNGLIRADVELDLSYANKFLILGIDHVGYYYKDEFYLHKIQRVEYDHANESAKVVLRHIFFEDMIFGKLIQDVRPKNQDAFSISKQTIDANTRWQTIMTDVTGQLSTSFYWQVPYEVIEFMTKNYRIEYLPKILFDGQKINGFQLHLANRIGEDKNVRIPYGSRVLDLKYEEDYSEIVTKLVVHGKGEEVGDGYGRRINISDVNFSRNGVKSPLGSLYLEDESITNTYGNDRQTPREGREIFEDIDDVNELAEAGYQHYLQVSRPQMLFTADVSDIGDVGIGDSVMIIRREYDVYFSARIHKLSVDLLYPEDAQVELGDYKHFKESKVERKTREKNNRVQGQISDRITRLKKEANDMFDREVAQWKSEYEQALIDAQAKVEAMRVEMESEFSTVRKDMSDRFESEKAEAYEEAQKNYNDISDRITNVVDTTREEMNTAFEQSVKESKEFADAVAEAKAQEIQSNLETFEAEHSKIISDFEESVNSSFQNVNSEVLGLVSRLGTLGDSLEDVEGTLSNTKTQLETQISNARAELEQSISATKIELENKISTTEQALSKVGEDLSNAKTNLQNQLDKARADLLGLEVGGRNLLPAFTSVKWSHTNLTEIEDYSLSFPSGHAGNSILFMDVEKHSYYTITFNSDYARYYIYEVLEDESLGKIIRTTTGSETYTFNTEDISRIRVSINTFSGNVQEEKNIWNLKLERGTVATDWTPALEDTEQKIININQTITNIEGELSTKVEQTEVDALKGTVTNQGTLLTQTANELSSKAEKNVVDTLTGRVTNAESSVTQNAKEIAKRLTKSVYDEDKKDTDAKITQWSNSASETAEGLTRVIGRVTETEKGVNTAQTRIEAEAGRIDGVLSRTSKVEGKVSDAELAIKANADGLALRATKTEVEQAIDGIEIGGRNLLPNSNDFKSRYSSRNNSKLTFEENYPVEEWATNEATRIHITGGTGNHRAGSNIANLPKNTEMVHSVYVKNLSEETFSLSFNRGFGGDNKLKVEPLEIKRVVATGVGRVDWNFVQLHIFTDDHMNDIEFAFWHEQLEFGTIVTDWTPAPEDIDTNISEVTNRVTTAEAELVVQAGEISQKASKSSLDRVTGRVSTAETSITQNSNEIAKRLVKSTYDTDKAKIDGDITKWSNLTTETSEGLKQSISRLSTAEGKVTKAQADIKANADEIATKVSNSSFNTLSGKVSNNTSAITQTSNEVKSKVTQAEVDYSTTHIDNGRIKTVKDVANYFNNQSSVTGALLIKTKISGRAMARVFIKGYDYTTDSSNIDAVISFYNYSESFLQHSYTSTGSKSIDRVRLFRDSEGNTYILLNDFDSTWKYPAIMVDRFDMSYSTDFTWGDGWEMSVVTSMPTGSTLITEVNGQDYSSIVSKHETDIIQNAKEIALKATQTELNKVTGRVSASESKLSVQAGEISTVVGKVDGNTKNISSVLQDTKSIKSTISSIEKDLVSQGSEIDQALNSITSKVWLGDVGGRNLIPKTVFPDDTDAWVSRGTNINSYRTTTKGLTDYLWVNRYGEGEANRYMAVLSPLLTENVVEGHEYTIQFKTAHRVNVNELFSYVYLMNEDGTSNQGTYDSQQTVIEIGESDYNGRPIQLHTITIKANFSGRARVLIGTHTVAAGDARFYVKEPKIEKGKATAYSRAPEDFLQMSELKITPDYWQLGSTKIDGSSVSSVLRGSPSSIDAIVSQMNLTGNLNVKGQIETISMNAVKGEFADLFAARVKAGDVDVDNITGRTAWFERLYTLNANIEKLTAQFVFTDAVQAKSLDAIEANIARVRTAFLKANVINGGHITSNTIEIKHLTGYDAMLETLMARTVFSNEVKALSIKAVEADIGNIRSKILTSDVIQASHIKAGTTLIDKIFSSTAMFERMMSKTAFVTTLNTVSIETDKLTIRRPDGALLISNGTQKFGSPIITKAFPETGVDYDGVNYSTTLRSSKTFERAYGEHAGRYANFSFRIGLDWSAKSASTKMRVVIRPGTLPSGVSLSTSNTEFTVKRGEQTSETISVRLPVPTFGAISWTLEFYRVGDSVADPITIRSERCWISA